MKWAWIVLLLVGCASTEIQYQAIPVEMIPDEPTLSSIKGEELKCLSDETYVLLVENHRKLVNYSNQLRALLTAAPSK